MYDNQTHHDPREVQRANILDAARRVFAHKGSAATMADVAQAAGVSQGLAYRYFASKEQIYRELIEHALDQADQATSLTTDEQSATPGQRLALLVTRLAEHRRDHLATFQLLDQVLSSYKVPTDLLAQMEQRREGFVAEFRQMIIEGQRSGEVAAGDPDQLLIAITATLAGLVRFGLHDPQQFVQRWPDASILLRMLKP